MSDIAITFAILAGGRGPVRLEPRPGRGRRHRRGARPVGHRRPRPDQALAGFGDPTVIFIATLFVVSEALDATGVTAWAGQQLIARVGRRAATRCSS